MLTLLPTSSLPALVPKAPFLRPLMKACHHHGRELQLPGAGMPMPHHIHGCLCFPFLYQSLRGSRTVSVITKLKESRFMQLCICHSFTLLQNLSSRQGRVEIGFKGACLMSLTSQFVQATISQALNMSFVVNLLPFSTYCPAFPYDHYFVFKELLKIPN